MDKADFFHTIARRMADYPLGSQANSIVPVIPLKLFSLVSSTSWYFHEYDPVTRTALAYVTGMVEDELGYVSLDELTAG